MHEGEEHRRQQDETDLKEDRQSDDQRGSIDRPFEPALAQCGDQRAGDDNGAARFGQQLADHRAETDDDGGEAQRVADPLLKRARDIGKRHACGEPDEQRAEQQADERRHLHPRDQQHDQRHATTITPARSSAAAPRRPELTASPARNVLFRRYSSAVG